MNENKKMAGVVDGMFVAVCDFEPTEDITDEELAEFFSLMNKRIPRKELVEFLTSLKITVDPDVFEALSDKVKRHFMILPRNGVRARYVPQRTRRRPVR